jgi:inner membrane protein
VTSGKRLHPGQYALVGVAQTVFYLLLLSLSEHTGFDFAFLVAGGATVALFALNVQWVFRSAAHGRRALAVFSVLYAFIYVLLRVEEYALLVGSLASFTAVALAMYFTRNMDWYGKGAAESKAGGYSSPNPTMRESMLD